MDTRGAVVPGTERELPADLVLLAIGFAGLIGLAGQVQCWDGGIGLPGSAPDAKPCLNGSMAYLPALGALIIVARGKTSPAVQG